jgi:hypothetical protein
MGLYRDGQQANGGRLKRNTKMNFNYWHNEIADMPMKDDSGNWYDAECGSYFDATKDPRYVGLAGPASPKLAREMLAKMPHLTSSLHITVDRATNADFSAVCVALVAFSESVLQGKKDKQDMLVAAEAFGAINPDLGRMQTTLRAGGDVTAALAEIAGRIQKAAAKFDAADEKVAGALPMLSGSPRQIAWATEIRAKAAEKNSKLSALKTATSAKYWIENRAKFAA